MDDEKADISTDELQSNKPLYEKGIANIYNKWNHSFHENNSFDILTLPGHEDTQQNDQVMNSENDEIELALKEIVKIPTRPRTKVACDICNKLFLNRSKMMNHRRMHDLDRVRYPCPQPNCGRFYASKQASNVHYRQAHLDEGFKCPVCNKVFAIKQTLDVHIRYHNGDFPYACDMCDKKFAQKGHLTTHKQVKHNNLRYVCTEPGCEKIFRNSMSLRNHRFTHTDMPFQCRYCDKKYPQKAKLKVHISVKHKIQLSIDDLESMRQFKDSCRTRHFFVKVDKESSADDDASSKAFENEMN